MQIHIFSGLGSSIFPSLRKGTSEIEALVDRIAGLDADHHIWNDWKDAYDAIIISKRKGRPVGKIALVGHSNGVLACAKLAEALSRAGVIVDYVGAIDPTAAGFPKFDHNTLWVDEFWASTGWPAIIRVLTNDRNGACRFVDGWRGTHKKFASTSSHVALASKPAVHKRIVDKIEELNNG